MPPGAAIDVDAVIFGGGIAGLWTLGELVRRGFDAVLLESNALGAGQTVWSQGIIHGGLKYSLSGLLTPSAEAIREMPAVWRACLAGEREPDLSNVRVRAQVCHLWRTESLRSAVAMIGARVGLRVSPRVLEQDERPEALRSTPGVVAELSEQVIDPVSLVSALAERNLKRMARIGAGGAGLVVREDGAGGWVIEIGDSGAGRAVALRPRRVILCAGNGNGALRERFGLAAGRMQVRPLRMGLAIGNLPALNGHCVDGARTRVTVTTDFDESGRTVWQIGGQIAEEGVKMGADEFVRALEAEMRNVLPNVEFSGVEWSWYEAPRAEAATGGGRRPEDCTVIEEGSVLTVWPTKLALAPRAAEVLCGKMGAAGGGDAGVGALAGRARPGVAAPPWRGKKAGTQRSAE